MNLRRVEIRRISSALLSLGLAFAPSPSSGQVEAYGLLRGSIDAQPLEILLAQEPTLGFADDVSDVLVSGQLWTSAGWSKRISSAAGWRLGLDTGLLSVTESGVFGDGRPLGEHLGRTLLLGETYLDLQPSSDGLAVLRIGKLRFRVGDGTIFDALAFGALLDLDWSLIEGAPPVALRAMALLPDGTFTSDFKQSPLFVLDARLLPRAWELGAFGAVLFDDDDVFLPLLDGPVIASNTRPDVDEPLESQRTVGWMTWTGLRSSYRSPLFRLRLDAILAYGAVAIDGGVRSLNAGTLRFGPRRVEVEVLGALGRLEAEIVAGPVRVRPFGLVLSGDDDLSDLRRPSFSAFPAVAPLLPRSLIFLGGATSPIQQRPQAVTLSPDGLGMLAAGTDLDGAWGPVIFGAGVYTFHALQDRNPFLARLQSTGRLPGEPGRWFGLEIDASADVLLGRSWAVGVDFGYFATGDFYGETPDAFLGLVGVSYARAPRTWGDGL